MVAVLFGDKDLPKPLQRKYAAPTFLCSQMGFPKDLEYMSVNSKTENLYLWTEAKSKKLPKLITRNKTKEKQTWRDHIFIPVFERQNQLYLLVDNDTDLYQLK